jgi:hypothetical protein
MKYVYSMMIFFSMRHLLYYTEKSGGIGSRGERMRERKGGWWRVGEKGLLHGS